MTCNKYRAFEELKKCIGKLDPLALQWIEEQEGLDAIDDSGEHPRIIHSNCLAGLFDWSSTPQGSAYWCEMYTRLRQEEG